MRDFFEPLDGPHWLKRVLTTIREALGDIWKGPLRFKDYPSTGLPDPAPFKQGTIYVSDEEALAYSNGVEWLRLQTEGGASAADDYESHLFDVSRDETTVIATGTDKFVFRFPYDVVLEHPDGTSPVRASLKTASSSGSVTLDVNVDGSTILSTKLTIDESEKSSVTAASQAVLSSDEFTDDSECTIDIDDDGTNAAGLKVWMIWRRNVADSFLLLEGDMTDGDDIEMLEGDGTDGDDLVLLE